MFARNKMIFLAGLAAVALWGVLFCALVQPNWERRELELQAAQDQLDQWKKYYQAGDGTLPRPRAIQDLEREEQRLSETQKTLKQVEFAHDVQGFKLAAAEGGDPMNYLDTMRRKVLEGSRVRYGIRLAPGLEDLGLRGESAKSKADVPLNLVRIFALERFFAAAKEAGVAEVQTIQYPKADVVPVSETESAEVERLFQVPLLIQFRSTERNFAQILYELQRPADGTRAYFCLRGFRVGVKDASSGLVEASVALGALLPVLQARELKIEINEEEPVEGPARPMVDPRGSF